MVLGKHTQKLLNKRVGNVDEVNTRKEVIKSNINKNIKI